MVSGAEKVASVLKDAPGEWEAVTEGAEEGKLRFEVQADGQQLADALKMLMASGVTVAEFAEVPADLEDVFMSLTK